MPLRGFWSLLPLLQIILLKPLKRWAVSRQVTMKTKADLKKEIEKRHIIQYKAYLFFLDSKYLNNPASDQEKNIVDKSSFI